MRKVRLARCKSMKKLFSLTDAMDAFFTSKLTHSLPGFTFTTVYIPDFFCRLLATLKIIEPRLRNLEGDPRYKTLLRKMKLPE